MTARAPCFDCLRRTWLLSELAGHLERHRREITPVLGVEDEELIGALGGTRRVELLRARAQFSDGDAERMRADAARAGLDLVCRHSWSYPPTLEALEHSAPAALYVASDRGRLAELSSAPAVAIVGTRRPSETGLELARELGRALAAAGVTVVSGMAWGIDSAAHEGAVAGGGATIAVLPGPADRAYPVRKSALYTRIRAEGAVLAEVPLGMPAWRWAMLARNRIIAGLAQLTVVVEAAARSGSLTTLAEARALDRQTAAVPGALSSQHATGTNLAIAKHGARLVRGPQDVLDLLFGEGIVEVPPPQLPEPSGAEMQVLRQIRDGATNVTDLGADALGALAGLELKGWVRRGAGGSLTPRM